MNFLKKTLIVTVLLWILSSVLIVFYYESKLKLDEDDVTIIGGFDPNKKYTAQEIIGLIKKTPEYIGDSITIYRDGRIRSDNGKFQGTISSVSVNDKASIDQEALDTGLPKPFLVYKLAAHYYRLQNVEEFRKDTLNKK